MGVSEARRPVTVPSALLALATAAAVLLITVWGAQRSRLLTLERRATDDAAVVAEVASGIAVDLERAVQRVGELGRDPRRGLRAPVAFVAVTPGDGGEAAPVLSASDRAHQEVAALLDSARDSGKPQLSPPVHLEALDGPRLLAIAATYRGTATEGSPQTTAERRSRLTGWVLEPLDPAALLEERLPPGMAATFSHGAVTWATAETAATRLPAVTIESDGNPFTITAGDPSEIAWAGSTVALVVLGLALGVAAAVAVLTLAKRLRDLTEEARDRAAQVQLIAEVAPLVQQSLELADVLPAVAVQLSDHFGLAGVALSTELGSNGQVELFSIGEAPAHDATAVLRPPEHVAAGETLALALQRGGRSVARLQLVAGRDLAEAELQSLRALTELVTAAVVNAALYASQQEAMRRLRELDVLKTVFLGTASHELRTPVTAIGGFASLLTKSWDHFDETQRRDFVERIGANARTLNAVVQDLLDFSLLDKGTLAVTIEEVDLGALVGGVVDRLGPMFSSHEVRFEATPAPPVAGDVNGLERIVTNLLANAVKFSPAGTTVSVTVGAAADGYGAELVVSDQGPGIPPEERQQVFTRFFRGSGDAVLQTRGVGIGLSVVAEFVARLRGDIVVDDAPGGGARFTVRLPASSDQLLAKEAVHAQTT